MPERWGSPRARILVRKIRKAGGTVERVGRAKLKITGPSGTCNIHEPADDAGKCGQGRTPEQIIREGTGLNLD